MEVLLLRNSLPEQPCAVHGRGAGATLPKFTGEDVVGSLPALGYLCVHLPFPVDSEPRSPLTGTGAHNSVPLVPCVILALSP